MPGMDKRVQGRLHAPCEAGERWRGTTLLTNTAKRTDPSRGWWAFRLFCPRRAARSASISRLLTAVSGLTVRFYWDCICSAKIPSPQRLEWGSAGAVCSSELLAGDRRVFANIYILWGLQLRVQATKTQFLPAFRLSVTHLGRVVNACFYRYTQCFHALSVEY